MAVCPAPARELEDISCRKGNRAAKGRTRTWRKLLTDDLGAIKHKMKIAISGKRAIQSALNRNIHLIGSPRTRRNCQPNDCETVGSIIIAGTDPNSPWRKDSLATVVNKRIGACIVIN